MSANPGNCYKRAFVSEVSPVCRQVAVLCVRLCQRQTDPQTLGTQLWPVQKNKPSFVRLGSSGITPASQTLWKEQQVENKRNETRGTVTSSEKRRNKPEPAVVGRGRCGISRWREKSRMCSLWRRLFAGRGGLTGFSPLNELTFICKWTRWDLENTTRRRQGTHRNPIL